jgi:hypothetical protein
MPAALTLSDLQLAVTYMCLVEELHQKCAPDAAHQTVETSWRPPSLTDGLYHPRVLRVTLRGIKDAVWYNRVCVMLFCAPWGLTGVGLDTVTCWELGAPDD